MGVLTTIVVISLFTSAGTQMLSETADWMKKKMPKPESEDKK